MLSEHSGVHPYTDELALQHSCYTKWSEDALVYVADGTPAPPLAERVHAALRALILDPEYPCVGARSAINQASYRFAMYDELGAEGSTAGLARDLYSFVNEQPLLDGEFSTFVASFDAPKVIAPAEFEALLWQQLARLHAVDRLSWDPAVSRDPADPNFSFSFAGRSFFVVGLAPNGERWARTFPWPTLAFNAHFMFEDLREDGQLERMQDVVRERDRELQGDINPNLGNFGEHPDARQYSGREVGDGWRCPVVFP